MAAVQSLLKSQFPQFGELKDPIIQLSAKSQISLPREDYMHAVSTCGIGHDVVVYYSKYHFLDTTTETLLAKLMLTLQI